MNRLRWLWVYFSFSMAMGQSGRMVFDDSQLHRIEVQINLPGWYDTLLADYNNFRENPDSVEELSRSCSFLFDGVRLDSVGFRMKGNFSYTGNLFRYKKPFKLEFDEWLNQRFDGLKSLNLNNGMDDPSMLREALSFRLMRQCGVPAPRVAWARLYVNGQYWGLYILVEQVDKTFLKETYGAAANNGNLYKTGRTASTTLQWLGSHADSVYEERSGLELKSGKDSWARLIRLINTINNLPQKQMPDSLPAMFDVEQYLKVLAVEKMVFSWDSYWGVGNNFYLYEHPDGSIRWIPWDMNETFPGLHSLDPARLFFNSSYLVPTDRFEERPLLKAILSHPAWKQQYLDNVCHLLHHAFAPGRQDSVVLAWHNLIAPAIAEDTNYLYSFESFQGSLMEKHVNADYIFPRTGVRITRRLPGLFPFMQQRRLWAASQLQLQQVACTVPGLNAASYRMSIYPNPASSASTITLAWSHSPTPVSQVHIINPLGQVVHTFTQVISGHKNMQLLLPGLSPGLYNLLKIDTDGSTAAASLVVCP